jgi:conjugal transfer pilus assembly protein TraD
MTKQHHHHIHHLAHALHHHHHRKSVAPLPIDRFAHHALGWFGAVGGGVVAGFVLMLALTVFGWRWTWLLPLVPAGLIAWASNPHLGLAVLACGLAGAGFGVRWDHDDRHAGGDLAANVKRRRGLGWGLRWLLAHGRRDKAVTAKGILLGRDEQHRPVRLLTGFVPSHTLVVGTTSSGKTVTQATILRRSIELGCGAIVVDPKGDDLLVDQLAIASDRARKPFAYWTPHGELSYNPFGHGTDSEIADKVLAGETWTEPHYQRQAQRYVAHAVRALRMANREVSLAALVHLMQPGQLEALARQLDHEQAQNLHTYLDSLTPEQHRGLAGTRDRLAILAESDIGERLAENDYAINLRDELFRGGVVLFSLEADRWPLLASMLAAAIVSDLITQAANRQGGQADEKYPAVIALDEFSAISPEGVVRLFGRARSAGLSLLLGTQELADLQTPEHPNLLAQVLGNTATVIAHRQRVPDSAELIAEIAGTKGTWTQTRRTDGTHLPTDSGTRTRTREFHIHPDDLKALPQGTAVVINHTHPVPRTTRIDHPGSGKR